MLRSEHKSATLGGFALCVMLMSFGEATAQFRGFRLIPLAESSDPISSADRLVRCAALYQYLSVFDGSQREAWSALSAAAKADALEAAKAEMPARTDADILERINMLVVARANDYVATVFDEAGDPLIIEKDLAACEAGVEVS